MSFLLQEAVWTSGLRGSQKLVAICLARYASDEGGSCRPAQETLADDTGLSERTVRDALAALEVLGFAQVLARGTNGRASRYRLHLDALPERPPKRARRRPAAPLAEPLAEPLAAVLAPAEAATPAESAGSNRQDLQLQPAISASSNRQNLPPIRSSDPVRDPVRRSGQVHTPRARARDPITRAIQDARRRFEVVALDGDAGDLEASVLAEHLRADDVALAERLTLERGDPASWEFLRWWLREFAAARRDGRPLPVPRARGRAQPLPAVAPAPAPVTVLAAAPAEICARWDAVLRDAAGTFSRANFDTWFAGLQPATDEHGLVIAARSDYVVEWLTKRAAPELAAAFARAGWPSPRLTIARTAPPVALETPS